LTPEDRDRLGQTAYSAFSMSVGGKLDGHDLPLWANLSTRHREACRNAAASAALTWSHEMVHTQPDLQTIKVKKP
jgi:hypothetical protein